MMSHKQVKTNLMLPMLNIKENLPILLIPVLAHVEAIFLVAILTLQNYLVCAFTINAIAYNSVRLHLFHPTLIFSTEVTAMRTTKTCLVWDRLILRYLRQSVFFIVKRNFHLYPY